MPPDPLTPEALRLPRLSPLLGLPLAAAILALGLWPAATLMLDPDIAWLLYVAGRVLDGARYGVDLLEVNPPLIVWWSMAVIGLSRFTGLGPQPIYMALVAVLVATSGAVLTLLLRRYQPIARHGMAGWIGLLILALLALPQGVAFGQREHLAVVLTLPFVVLTGLRLAGWTPGHGPAVAMGVAAGLGFALKPHFLVPLACVELTCWFASRRRIGPLRSELVAVAGTGLGYAALALLLHPDWLPATLELAPLYRGYLAPTLAQFLENGGTALPLALAALFCWLALRGARPADARLSTLLVAALGGFVLSAVLQWKVWHYLFVPIVTLSLSLLAVLTAETAGRARGGPLRLGRVAAQVLLGIALLGIGWEARYWVVSGPDTPLERDYRRLVGMVRRHAGGGPVAVLATGHGLAFPLVLDAEVEWSLRLPSLWPLTAIHRAVVATRGAPVTDLLSPADPRETRFIALLREDLLQRPPRLLVIPAPDSADGSNGFSRRFDYQVILSRDLAIRELLATFVALDSVGYMRVYLPRGGKVPPP